MVKNRELSRRIGEIAIPHVPRFPFDLGLHSPYIFSYECIKSFNPLENHKQFCENSNFSTSIIVLYFLEASHRIIYLHSIVMLVIITFQYHKHSFRVGEIYIMYNVFFTISFIKFKEFKLFSQDTVQVHTY